MINRPKIRPSASRPNLTPSRPAPQQPKPSLANHLLSRHRAAIEDATQLSFLSQAGCGTLSTIALEQWLTQQGHMSRALVPFIGSLTSKIRLPEIKDPQKDTTWRALDLLVSTLSNATKELEFLRTTMLKYGLRSDGKLPKHGTKGLVDLLLSTSSPGASLLEGMVLLWSIEHVSPLRRRLKSILPLIVSALLHLLAIRKQLHPNRWTVINVLLAPIVPPKH